MPFSDGPSGPDKIPDTILQRIARADTTAIQECLDAYGDLVWTFAKMKTDSVAGAERLTLQIFHDLWKCAGQFDPDKCKEMIFVSLLAHRSKSLDQE